MKTLDSLHRRLRAISPFQRLTLVTRTTLAIGFVAPGLTKLVGRDFAPGIDPASPMGVYFHAFHGTGAYYGFVGLVQVVAGALLLSRRTALLGAVLYLPVIANIFVLTAATRFGVGTPVLTGLMTLGCVWLLLWDGHRLTGLVSATPPAPAERAVEPAAWDLLVPDAADPTARGLLRAAYVLGTAGAFVFTLSARALVPFVVGQGALAAALLAVPVALVGWARVWFRPARPVV